MLTNRSEFLGLPFDQLTMGDVLNRLAAVRTDSAYQYVVTPNVDHIVRLNSDPGRELLPLYRDADLCLCDSRILKLLASFHEIHLTLVPGSDLTARLFAEVIEPGDRIAVIGGTEIVVGQLGERYPGISFVHYQPPMGLRHDPAARQKTADFIAGAGARFAFIALGSPQQEMIAAAVRASPKARGTALCIGASLDFIVGRQKRAPRWMQRMGLEWAHRLASDPRRMWRRYLVEGPRIFFLAARHRKRARPS